MVGIDPFLYVAFGVGWIAGRLVHRTSPWVSHAASATVVVLVFSLGVRLTPSIAWGTLYEVGDALVFAVSIVVVTWGISWWLRSPRPAEEGRKGGIVSIPPLAIVLIVSLATGLFVGRAFVLPTAPLLQGSLYVLLFLVAWDLQLSRAALRGAWVPVVAACAGAILPALTIGLLLGFPLRAGLGTALAFGFYSLAGPTTTAAFGPVLGLAAFLTNFFRESLTMLSAPWIGSTAGAEGVAAVGGATSMDTTLFFVSRYGGPTGPTLGLATGVTLTILASLAVPLVLGAPVP